MKNADKITLIIPTHNRHGYLNRVLAYYGNETGNIKIIIVDSSKTPFTLVPSKQLIYFHLPQLTLNQKVAFAIQKVNTPYVFMCADDDFILLNSVDECIDFLESNINFSCASGSYLYYIVDEKDKKQVNLTEIYNPNTNYSIEQENAEDRIRNFFKTYRTLYYAVHRTEVYLTTFNNPNYPVTNLFLTEYLTGTIPLIHGKYKSLNSLYQIREYSNISGDKITANIDVILRSPTYSTELSNFINFVSNNLTEKTKKNLEKSELFVKEILSEIASRLMEDKNNKTIMSAEKKVGTIINALPVIGKKVIEKYRSNKKKHVTNKIKSKYSSEEIITIINHINQNPI